MAHKVCIDGTAYEIDGGKAMVDGTVYEIDHGVANVGGTAYEVGFDDGMRTVNLGGTIANAFSQGFAYFEVDGKKYYRDIMSGSIPANQIYTFPIGTQIRFVAKAISGLSDGNKATIKLGSQEVAVKSATKGGGEVTATYDYVLNGNVSVSFMVTAIESGTIKNAVSTITINEL